MTPDRLVPAGVLLARGLEAQEVHLTTGGSPTIEWHKLCRLDGSLALAVLTEGEFDKIRQELGRAGIPDPATLTRQDVFNLTLTIAENECPPKGTRWYSADLHSAVACAQLLALVHQSWGFDAEVQRQQELNLFAAKLGVATSVEQV